MYKVLDGLVLLTGFFFCLKNFIILGRLDSKLQVNLPFIRKFYRH